MSVIGKRKNTVNKRRKGKLAFVLPWLRRFGMSIVVLIGLLWVGSWFFLSEADTRTADWIGQKTLNITADMGFVVDDILVEGRMNTDPNVLHALINVKKGDPLFSFDPTEAKALVERVDWVKRARVERRLPDTIYINIEERAPLALWQKNKKLSLLDSEGEVITAEGLSLFKDLIVITGEGAPAQAPSLIGDLKAESALFERAKSAAWIGERRWDVTLSSGVVVRLPEQDVGLALRRLAFAQEEDKLLDKDLKSIDLREQDRIVVRTRPGAVQEYKAGLKTGNNI